MATKQIKASGKTTEVKKVVKTGKAINIKKVSAEVLDILKQLETEGTLNKVQVVISVRKVEEGKQVDRNFSICSPMVTDD